MTGRSSLRVLCAAALCLAAPLAARPQSDGIRFRVIAVPTEDDAALLIEQLAGGIPFDELARQFSIDVTRDAGGLLGPIPLSDMRPEYRNALEGLAPGATSPPVPVDGAFMLFHPADPLEERWMRERADGLEAFAREDYEAADALLSAAVETAEEMGALDLRLAQSLTTLAIFDQSQDRLADSLALLERVLQLQTAALGEDHPFVGETLNNLADVHRFEFRFAEAETLYLRSLGNLERSLGRQHPNIGVVLNNLAMLYQDQNQHARAQPLFLQSLGIMEAVVGTEDPSLAGTLVNLGRAYHAQSNYTQAARAYRRALTMLEPVAGIDDATVQEVRRYLTAASLGMPMPEQTDALSTLTLQ